MGRRSLVALLSFALLLVSLPAAGRFAAAAGTVGLAAVGTTYFENFDTLANTGASGVTPNGWAFSETGTNANETYAAGTGSSNSGNTYSFGADLSTERAFGGLQSGSLNPTIGASFTNNTGTELTRFDITYTGEQWRIGALGRTDRIDFQWSASAVSLTTGAWSNLDALDFTAPVTSGTVGPLDGNFASNRTTISGSIEAVIPPGASLWIRWVSFDASGADDGLSVDDFSLTPRVTDPPPSVTTTSPATGAVSVAVDANITVSFSEAVNAAGDWFAISCTSSGAHSATASGGPTTFTLDPVTNFVTNESCTVTVFAANIADQDADDPPDNMAGNFVLTFTTIAPPTRIHAIQGASHTSPLAGTLVLNVPGIVTARASNGFYIQDPTPDVHPATSEALFVFTGSAPAVTVGDAVSARGTVQEFRPGGASTINLTTTELANPGVGFTIFSNGNPLPLTTVIGVDRTPPAEVIEDDATGSVETTGVFDPATDGIDFWESLEGMRLQLNDARAVGPRNRFGEIAFVVGGAGIRTSRGGIVIRANDYNPERLIIDDVLMTTPSVNTGDMLSGETIGVLDYSFGNFKLLVTKVGTVVSGGLMRETTTPADAGQLAMATFNVENLDPNDGAAKFNALGAMIVNNLRSPDLLALEEIQDNNGPTNDSVVDASLTLAMLREAVIAAGGPAYEWRLIDPVDDQDGGQPGGNIRQGFFFRTDRGLTFVDRPGGTSTTATVVVAGPSGPQLSASPGRVDPLNSAFIDSRKPLVGEFLYSAQRLFVIANHFNSKSGDDPLFGHRQPPIRGSEVQRIQQADVLADFVSDILALDSRAMVAVIGDLNDFEFSPALSRLEAAGLTTLIETLPQDERYSYVFDGNSQTLDHMQVSAGLLASLVAFDSVHANSEFADQISDHDPQAARFFAVTTDALCALVESLVEGSGVASALCAKLEAAAASGARGNVNAKAGQIGAFIDQVNAQRGKVIADADATRLILLAEML